MVYLEINSSIGTIINASPVYLSEPWGFMHRRYFTNAVFHVETALELCEILPKLHKIEANLGRIRSAATGYIARTMDIDIIAMDDTVYNEENVTLPHPRMRDRLFVLLPLFDIAPQWVHPRTGENIQELIRKCSDTGKIRKTMLCYYD